jgi:hypothetical protein
MSTLRIVCSRRGPVSSSAGSGCPQGAKILVELEYFAGSREMFQAGRFLKYIKIQLNNK